MTPEIWFAPLHPNPRAGGHGAADYFALFDPASQWQRVASNVAVFQIYIDLLRRTPDAQIRKLVNALAERHIALAIEMPVLVDTGWCEPGKEKSRWMLPLVMRLKRLGAKLQYLSMVGPLVDGHVYTNRFYCHRPISEVAADAAETVKAVRRIYPDIIVGDIEPLAHRSDYPDWSELGTWFREFQRAADQPIMYLHLDVRWRLPWKNDLVLAAREARAAGVKIGVIYHSDDTEHSSESVSRDTASHEDEVNSLPGMPPDHVIFQTWRQYPDHVLPESDPNSMSGIVLNYLRAHRR